MRTSIKEKISNLLNSLSIRNKIIFITLFTIILSIAISFTFIIYKVAIIYKKEMVQNMQMNARLIGEYSVTPLTFGDKDGANETLSKLKSIPQVKHGILFNEHDKVYAEIHSIDEEIKFPESKNDSFHKFTKNYLIVFEPIIYNNIRYGSILIYNSTEQMREQIRDYVLLMLILMAGVILFSFVLASALQRYISQPILNLAKFTNKISSDGDYSRRINKTRKDEIGVLISRFNDMLEQIQKREQEKEKAENLIKESNKKLNLIIDNSPIGILYYDKDGVIRTCNKGMEKLFKFNKDDVVGKNLNHTIQNKNMVKAFKKSLDGKQSEFVGIYTSTISKQVTHIRGVYTPLRTNDGIIDGGIGLFEDMSERTRLEKLQLEKETAEASNKAKSIFLANMSHEIRTPLNAVLGFSQIMQKDKTLSPEHIKNLETINNSGEHLLSLINEILEMSKIEAGRIALNNTTFNLGKLLHDLYTMFKVRSDSQNLFLDQVINKDVPEYIVGDEGKIRQIIINLMGNAIKFTNEGGIILRASAFNLKEGLKIVIDVEDTGIGIAEDEQEKIFQHFERSQKISTRHGGTGLGLAISREYALMMNGAINLKSKLGKGSVFSFHFLTETGSKDNVSKELQLQNVVSLHPDEPSYKILVVDDKKPNRDLLAKMLEMTGFTVEKAADGVESIDKFIHWKPDLILMDMFMPEMDGFEAIKRIREMKEGKEIPIFAVTASVFEKDKQSILDVGANEFIKKPFKEPEIHRFIAKHLKVKYIYEEDKNSEDNQSNKSENLKNILNTIDEIIKSIPQDVLNKMQEALINGDLNEVKEHATLLTDNHKAYAEAVGDAANNFDMDLLYKLLNVEP